MYIKICRIKIIVYLCRRNGWAAIFLENKQYKIGTTSNNAAYIFNGKLCITVVNENGQEVVLKNKTIIFTIFDDELDDNITVNNNYGNVQLVKDKLKVIAVLWLSTS